MKRINVQGTLGDTFIVLLKIKCMNQRVISYHFTKHAYWYGAIAEIYSMYGNVEVRFVREPRFDLPEVTSDCHEGKMEFFPMFDLYNNFRIEEPYKIIQPHSGKLTGLNMKKLPEYIINEMVFNSSIKCVLLGTSADYVHVGNCINLINKTSIKDTVTLIQNCNEFIGPEGLLSFIALSQKKPSTIYYTDSTPVERRIIGTPWKEFSNLIQMRKEWQ